MNLRRRLGEVGNRFPPFPQTRHAGPSTACKAGARDTLQPKAGGRRLRREEVRSRQERSEMPASAGMTRWPPRPAPSDGSNSGRRRSG
ncbi:hypothetical protein EIK56_20470 [Sphingomonas sp. C8-2]|nr:hypothetical protein EIK56_20470 [Sphingomonas sp. C8-2]